MVIIEIIIYIITNLFFYQWVDDTFKLCSPNFEVNGMAYDKALEEKGVIICIVVLISSHYTNPLINCN